MTLGTCSKCNDVTDQVTRSQKVDYPMAWYFPNSGEEPDGNDPVDLTTYSLPNGLALDNRDPNQYYSDQSNPVLMTARGNVAPSQTVSFKDATTLLWSAAILQVPNASIAIDGYGQWIDPTVLNVQATECALYLCIKEYTSRMLDGQLLETFTDVSSTRDANSWQVYFNIEGEAAETTGYVYLDGVSPAVDALYTNNTFFQRTDLSISVPPSATASNLDANNITMVNATQPGIYTLSAYIAALFTSANLANATLPAANQSPCTLNHTAIRCGHLNDVTGMVVLTEPLSADNATAFDPPAMSVLFNTDSLAAVFATLAESITSAMRTPATSATVAGQLGTSRTLLRVRWPWLALPLLCMLVATVFLLVSIYEARVDGTPLWKSAGLPYLAHGLDRGGRGALRREELGSAIEKAAEEVQVRLWRGGEEGVLMLRGKEGEEKEEEEENEEGEQDHTMGRAHERMPLSAGAGA